MIGPKMGASPNCPGTNLISGTTIRGRPEARFDTTRTITNMIYNGAMDRHKKIIFILSHTGGAVPFLAWMIALLESMVPLFFAKFSFESCGASGHKSLYP